MIISGYNQTYSPFYPTARSRAGERAFVQLEHAAAAGCRKNPALCEELVDLIDSVGMEAKDNVALTDDPALLADLDMACTVKHLANACTSLGRKYRGIKAVSGAPNQQDPSFAKPQLAAHYLAIGCSSEVQEYSFYWPAVVRSWNPLFITEHVTNNPATACQNLIELFEDDKSLPSPSAAALEELHDRKEALEATGYQVDQARASSDAAKDERIEANSADERAQSAASYQTMMDTLQASTAPQQQAAVTAPQPSNDRGGRSSATTTTAHTNATSSEAPASPPPPRAKQQTWLRGTGDTGEYHYGKDYAVSLATTACEYPLQQQCSGRLVHPTLPYTSGSTDDGAFSLGKPFCSEQGPQANPQFKCTISCTSVCEAY